MKPAADAVSYTALLPYHSYDPDGRVFAQDDGSLGLAWQLEAPPCDGASEAELGTIAARLEALIRLMPEGAAAQFIFLSSRDVKPRLTRWTEAATVPAGSILHDLGLSRARGTSDFCMAYQGAPFVARSCLRLFTLRVFPRWPVGGTLLLRPAALDARLREEYLKAKKGLLELAGAVENLLPQAGITSARVDEDTLVGVVYRILNPIRHTLAPPPPQSDDRLVRERMALSHLDFDFASGTLTSEGIHRRILSAADLPATTWAGMLSLGAPAVLDLVPEALVAVNIEVPSQEATKQLLARKKRLAFCQLSTGDVKVDMAAMKSEVDQALGEMFLGARVVSARLHVAIADPRVDAIESRARAVVSALGQVGLSMVEEKGLALSLFMQALPLAYEPSNDRMLKRGRKMMGQNLAHLLPAYGAFRGTPSPDMLLLNRRGEPVTFSLFDSNVAPHAIVCGVTGSGKSVFANNLLLSALRRGARFFVIDRGNSYRKLARLLDGEYVEFHPDRPRSINPCGKAGPKGAELSREKLIFLRDLVSEMATRGREDLAPRDQSLVEAAVAQAFQAKPGQEVLVRDIQAALEQLAAKERSAHTLALCLSSFVNDGAYGAFFDRPGQIDFQKPLVVFELGETALEKSVVSVILMAIIQRIGEVCGGRAGGEKYVLIDEAWTLLRSKATARFIENVFRTYRKYRTSAVMLTQQVSDFEGPTGEAIRANAPNRIYLKQTPETILAMQKLLDLTPQQKDLLSSLATVKGRFSELLIVTPEVQGVARLVQDPLSYWITTSDPTDNAYLDELAGKYEGRGETDAMGLALREAAVRYPKGRPR